MTNHLKSPTSKPEKFTAAKRYEVAEIEAMLNAATQGSLIYFAAESDAPYYFYIDEVDGRNIGAVNDEADAALFAAAPAIIKQLLSDRAAAYAQGRADTVKGIRTAVEAEQMRPGNNRPMTVGYKEGIATAIGAIDKFAKDKLDYQENQP